MSADWQGQLKLTGPCASISSELARPSSNDGWVPKAVREGEPPLAQALVKKHVLASCLLMFD